MEAKNETGKNPAGAQSSATGATLSGKLAAVCKYCGDEINLYGYLWLDSGKVFPQYCRSSAGGQLHKADNVEVSRKQKRLQNYE